SQSRLHPAVRGRRRGDPPLYRAASHRSPGYWVKCAAPGNVPEPLCCAVPDEPSGRSPLTSGFGEAMGLSAELVVTTLVGLGLGWLVGGIGAATSVRGGGRTTRRCCGCESGLPDVEE